MNVKAVLESHKDIDNRIYLDLEELVFLRALSTQVTKTFAEDQTRGTGRHSDRVGEYSARIVDLKNTILKELEELVVARHKIKALTKALDNESERIILERIYICHETYEGAAAKLGYSPRHAHRLGSAALKKLQDIYSDKNIDEIEVA